MLDWQNILVALILLLAALYVVRKCWDRLRLLLKGAAPNQSGCHSGKCGGCGE